MGKHRKHKGKFFRRLGNAIKKAASNIGKNIGKAEKKLEKVVGGGVNVAHKTLDFVDKHSKDIKKVVDVTAGIAESAALAVGQPELAAPIFAAQKAIDKAIDTTQKAKQIVDVVDRSNQVLKAIRHKESVSKILNKAGDAMISAGSVSNDPRTREMLLELGNHTKEAGEITQVAIQHGKDIHKIVKDTHQAIKRKDVKGVIKNVEKGVKKGQVVGKDVKRGKEFYRNFKQIK